MLRFASLQNHPLVEGDALSTVFAALNADNTRRAILCYGPIGISPTLIKVIGTTDALQLRKESCDDAWASAK
jgi:hypothetical protein